MTPTKGSDDTTTPRAAGRIDGKQAAVAGVGIAAGLAIGAALFANWRKPTADGNDRQDARAPRLDDGTVEAIDATPDMAADAVGAMAGSEIDADATQLHAMGTPTTLPIDDSPRDYTGEREPDMAVDYLPEADFGSADTHDR